jgi:hypothetical protein
MLRLCLSVVAFLSCSWPALVAQGGQRPSTPRLPTGLSSATASDTQMVVTERGVYVLRDDVLWLLDPQSLVVRQRFDFRRAAPAGALPPGQVEEPPPPPTSEPAAAGKRESYQAATKRALVWLKQHQDEDGRFDCDGFMKHDLEGVPCDGAGSAVHDIGVTGLAVLAFLADGSTMRAGPFRDEVKMGVAWLREQQQDNGLFGTAASHDFIYDHAIATLAICEAYGLSNYKLLQSVAQKGLNYLEAHRNPYSVWRYQPRDNDNDTSVTTWATFALVSGDHFGLEVNKTALQMAAVWYDQVTDDQGRAGYTKAGERSSRQPGDHATRFPPESGEAMTAAALAARQMLGQTVEKRPLLARSAALLQACPPQWQPDRIDPYYWYMGTLATWQFGGEPWQVWSQALAVLPERQRQDGNFAGSWDPIGVWDLNGGRIYATALYALTLRAVDRAATMRR